MAYNNYYPATYQPTYFSPMYSQQTQNNGIIWVQGEAGAKSYLVAPNTTVQLWDSEKQVIYLKSADASGMPSMKVLDYKVREQPTGAQGQQVGKNTDYALKSELTQFKEQLDALRAEVDTLALDHKPKKAVEE